MFRAFFRTDRRNWLSRNLLTATEIDRSDMASIISAGSVLTGTNEIRTPHRPVQAERVARHLEH